MIRHDCIGVRRETKSHDERRSPLTPAHVRLLCDQGIETIVQPSSSRIFTDIELQRAGATIKSDLSECPVVFGVKEMPNDTFEKGRSYVFFSHTHKAQPYNMPMLRAILDAGSTLIDYELITDESGRRQISFGRFAGLAGMIDALWAFGQRLRREGFATPLESLHPAHAYDSLEDAMRGVAAAGRDIAAHGLHPSLPPLVCGIAGTGASAAGAQEIFDLLPVRELSPGAPAEGHGATSLGAKWVHKVVYPKGSLFERVNGGGFDADEYAARPDLYREALGPDLDGLDILIHAIYWEERFPRLVTRERLREAWGAGGEHRLRLIADISCDIGGSVEATLRPTTVESPTYLYRPDLHTAVDGLTGPGPLILARDNLPCELPRESSDAFGSVLVSYVPKLLRAIDGDGNLRLDDIPGDLRRAVIVDAGELAAPHRHLRDALTD